MKDKIKKFYEDKESLTNELKEWVKDTSVPFSERWDTFMNSRMAPVARYIIRYQGINWDDQFDWIERHQRITIDQIDEWFDDDMWEPNKVLSEGDKDPKKIAAAKEALAEIEEKRNLFREDAMNKFSGGFILDW